MQSILTLPPTVFRPWSGPSLQGAIPIAATGSPAPAGDAVAIAPPEATVASPAKAGGAIGTAVGAAAGRLLLPTGAAVGAGSLARLALSLALPALPGPVGIGLATVAGIAGFAGGIALESKTTVGRLVGGLAGGVAGTAVGAAVGAAGWKPSAPLAHITSRYTLRTLPKKLLDTDYFGYPSLRNDAAAVNAIRFALPGDIICAHHENIFEGAAFMTRAAGARADYTHMGLVTDRGTIIDMVTSGAHERDKKAWLKFTHLAVLRPHYSGADSLFKTVEGARQAMTEKTYDHDLKLGNDPTKEYCTEFVYNRLLENAPEIHLKEQKFFNYRFITPDAFFDSPDIDVAYNSGSNFWLNHLSRYC